MSHSARRTTKTDRYTEDGLRVKRSDTHSKRLEEKRLNSILHSRSLDVSQLIDEDDLGDDPHWLYKH